jgi:transposase
MKIQRAYKVELKPNNKQRTLLKKSAGVARFAYNLALDERIKKYSEDKTSLTAIGQHKSLCARKKEEFPWMYEVSKCAPQEAIRDLGGNIKEDLSLDDRIYICECGHIEDRDLNASINIENVGLSTLSSRGIKACGESVRLQEVCDSEAVSLKQEENKDFCSAKIL